MGNQTNQPKAKFRSGAVTATVWENNGKTKDNKEFSYSTVSLERSYKDNNDAWQKTSILRLMDLPRAQLVLSKAYEFLAMSDQNQDDNNGQ